MVTVFLAFLAGGVGGGALALLLSRHVARRTSPAAVALDPELDRQIDTAAAQWAAAHDRPAAAPLIADKLRLAYVLNQRPRPRRRRWSR